MGKRPVSITIIGSLLLILGIYSLVVSLLTMNNPAIQDIMQHNTLPMTVQYVLMYAGVAVLIISGIGILTRRNWARFLYLIWGSIGIIIQLVTAHAGMILIPGVIFFVIIVYFLFRAKASAYFVGSKVE